MLKLENIKKDYVVAKDKVHALKGISLTFRENEFVSVLGPSGCGKTTLLNIIGGLDHATEGDLLIDNISTSKYTDRDWDTYRNHRVGFIFQSYNLIPHQTILENVELALKISGFPKDIVEKKSKEALDKVGLKDQYKKKPNQLSGGQCQRVAIARALVNDPDILLADEPTGALDTKTSVQIMDLIKEISKNTLVIMVTHNPDIANKYSTRIINLLDGEVVGDSNPFKPTEKQINKILNKQKTQKNNLGKSKLKVSTTFNLSLRNLLSKIKRTLLVCFAGSIGIIGVATVLCVSTGVTNYITKMQNDMLAGNAVSITTNTINIDTLLDTLSVSAKADLAKEIIEGKVNVNNVVEKLLERTKNAESTLEENVIDEKLIKFIESINKEYIGTISYDYGLDLSNNIYTDFTFVGHDGKDKEKENLSITGALNRYRGVTKYGNGGEFSTMSSYLDILNDPFSILPKDIDDSAEKFIEKQYDILKINGDHFFPKGDDEIMLVVDQDQAINDIYLAQVGYYSQKEFMDIMAIANENAGKKEGKDTEYEKPFPFEQLIGKEFRLYDNDQIFEVVTSSDEVNYSFYGHNSDGEIISKEDSFKNLTNYNYLASIPHDSTLTPKKLKITSILKPKKDMSYFTLKSGFYYSEKLASEFINKNKTSNITNFLLNRGTINSSTSVDPLKTSQIPGMTSSLNGFGYIDNLTFPDGEGFGYFDNMPMCVGKGSLMNSITSLLPMPIPGLGASYSNTPRAFGAYSIPSSIKLYNYDFESKEKMLKALDEWNENKTITIDGVEYKKEDRAKLTYTDTLSLIISLVSTLIDIVTYSLVSFTALSLLVSTVMIAIITYVSVIERIKEIGVIRSLGGRKRDVSRLFIAETVIEGLISGAVGLGISAILSYGVIDLIVFSLSGIFPMAVMTWKIILIMMGVSVLLTLLAGLIPARLAAKKDPVDALRTE